MASLVTLSGEGHLAKKALVEIQGAFKEAVALFCKEPLSFIRMMDETGCIIMGSTALHFLLRHPLSWKPNHVDLVAPKGNFKDVLNFILSLPGAKIRDAAYVGENERDLAERRGITRMVKIETPLAKFNVNESCTESPFHPLPFLWGTHLMNALTSKACISAYPDLTLQEKTLVVNPNTKGLHTFVERYKALGWTIFESPRQAADVRESCHHHVVCGRRDRMLGDRDTWIIPTSGHNQDQTWRFLSEGRTTCWRLGGRPCKNRECFMASERSARTYLWVYNDVLGM